MEYTTMKVSQSTVAQLARYSTIGVLPLISEISAKM